MSSKVFVAVRTSTRQGLSSWKAISTCATSPGCALMVFEMKPIFEGEWTCRTRKIFDIIIRSSSVGVRESFSSIDINGYGQLIFSSVNNKQRKYSGANLTLSVINLKI